MDSRRTIQVLGFAARALLAFMALAGIATAWVWLSRPQLVDPLQEQAQARFVRAHEQSFEAAKSALKEGEVDRGIELLEDLLPRLEKTKKRDRLSAIKRDALKRLAGVYQNLEKPSEALRAYDELIAFDDRDLEARVERARLLLRVPERRTEGEEEIERLHRLAPAAPVVAMAFLDLACSRRDLTAAVRAVHTLYRTSMSSIGHADWRVFWDTGNNFSREQSWGGRADLEVGDRVLLTATMEESADLLRFRVDLPRAAKVALEDLSFSFRSGGDELRLPSGDLKLRLRGMTEPRPGVVAARLGSPASFFFFRLPEALPVDGRTEAAFAARVKPLIPAEVRSLIEDAAMAEATRNELRGGAPEVLRFFEDILADSGDNDPPIA